MNTMKQKFPQIRPTWRETLPFCTCRPGLGQGAHQQECPFITTLLSDPDRKLIVK